MKKETICVQGGYTPGNGEPRQLPIVQSTTFKYDTSEDMGRLFDLEASGYFYSRLQNPTNDAVAAKICALEGGTAAMLTSSGQAANFFALFNIASCGPTARTRNSAPPSAKTRRPSSARRSRTPPSRCWTSSASPMPRTRTACR